MCVFAIQFVVIIFLEDYASENNMHTVINFTRIVIKVVTNVHKNKEYFLVLAFSCFCK